MNSTQLKDYFRSQVRDDVAPYLWSDEELFVYMNEAQSMFVRRSGGIFDVSSEATEVSVATGEAVSELHPSILNIRKAVLNGTRELVIINLADESSLDRGRDYTNTLMSSLNHTIGRVSYMIIGEERDKCRWLPIPDTDATVVLAIVRQPLVEITGENQEFEIAKEHHVHLADQMMAVAYMKQDADTFNPKAAAEAEQRFSAYCVFVKREWERYRHKPRTVSYGGY